MTTTELEAVRAKTLAALQTVEEDASASPVLLAVVREFSNKANKAVGLGEDDRAWEAVVELEQAGDSAKAAAEADVDAATATTESVLDAHLAICMLKAGFGTAVK
jgi:hypothetical protein